MKPRSLRRPAAFAALTLSLTSLALGSGYEFEGIGVREVSRGGAAIAESANWSAIYWNPANVRKAAENGGSAGVEIFGGQANGHDSNSLSGTPVGAIFDKKDMTSGFLLAAAGAVWKAGRLGLGVGVYTPLLQGVDFTGSSVFGMDLHYKGAAGIVTTAFQAGMRVAPKLYAGGGVNVLYGRLSSDSTLTNFIIPGNTAKSKLEGDGVALEGVFGLRYEPAARWTVGAVYRSGADVPVKGSAKASTTFGGEERSDFRYELRHPPTAGVGVAWRATDRWSFHTDYTRTYWKRFTNAFDYETPGVLLADTPKTFHWRNTWKLKVGSEFQATDRTSLMAGYSFDRPALDAESVDIASTLDVPMHRVYGGAGHKWTDRWETLIGGVYGAGRRSERDATYRLSGWQLMLESRWRLGRSRA